ncbi:MAG TPA: MBL fold metallo-hydrolase [Candidatus Limnocylindrales bacterium]|nr:MBL fold metallo-hydrolase [Candidatus Limnocylindrales bacterium]
MQIRQFRVEGLGHLSTLVADETAGVAAVVDPRRDVDCYLAAARELDVRITHVVETHLHNDYVSGGRDLAALTGSRHVIGAGAELRHEHGPVRDGETFDVGSLRFTSHDTPGHTPEHVAYSVADLDRGEDPALLFSGGSLLVGAVGRTDLLGEEHARDYARAMHRSLHEVVLAHDDHVAVHPTHGAGSLCATGIASTPTTTIGYERRHNALLRVTDVEAFATRLLRGQPAVPHYFARMRPTNQAGPVLLGGRVPEPRPLSLDGARSALAAGALLLDLRPPADHAVSHVPGSLSIPLGPSFGTWLGWVVEPARPLVLILERTDDWDEAVRQALRIGAEGSIVGHLRGGLGTWSDAGAPLESNGRLSVDELAATIERAAPADAPLVIDVRQANEYETGHVPGSIHIAAGSLPDRLAELPRQRPIATICASGLRSSIAASILRSAGFDDVSWVASGVSAWRAAGHPTVRGDQPTRPTATSRPGAAGTGARAGRDAGTVAAHD